MNFNKPPSVYFKTDNPALKPQRAHPTDAGADLFSQSTEVIEPGTTKLIDTGVAVKIPTGCVGLVFSRSSQGAAGISLANSVGVIDSDYRGNLLVLLKNSSDKPYEIKHGKTKVAQLVILPILLPDFVDVWNDTERGNGGFGSTGS